MSTQTARKRMTVEAARMVALTHDATEAELRSALRRLQLAAITGRNLSYLDILHRRILNEDWAK